MNIAIMRAFVEVRKALLLQTDLKAQLKQIRDHLGQHDAQLNQIYEVPIAIGRESFRRKSGTTEMGREGKDRVQKIV